MKGTARVLAALAALWALPCANALAAEGELPWPYNLTPRPVLSLVSGEASGSLLFRNPSGDPFEVNLEQRFALRPIAGVRAGMSLTHPTDYVCWVVHETWHTGGDQTDASSLNWDGQVVSGPRALDWRCDRLEFGVEALHERPHGPVLRITLGFDAYSLRLAGATSVDGHLRSDAGIHAGWMVDTAVGTFGALLGASTTVTSADQELQVFEALVNVLGLTDPNPTRYSLEVSWSWGYLSAGHEWHWTEDALTALEVDDVAFDFTLTRLRLSVWYAKAAIPIGQ